MRIQLSEATVFYSWSRVEILNQGPQIKGFMGLELKENFFLQMHFQRDHPLIPSRTHLCANGEEILLAVLRINRLASASGPLHLCSLSQNTFL